MARTLWCLLLAAPLSRGAIPTSAMSGATASGAQCGAIRMADATAPGSASSSRWWKETETYRVVLAPHRHDDTCLVPGGSNGSSVVAEQCDDAGTGPSHQRLAFWANDSSVRSVPSASAGASASVSCLWQRTGAALAAMQPCTAALLVDPSGRWHWDSGMNSSAAAPLVNMRSGQHVQIGAAPSPCPHGPPGPPPGRRLCHGLSDPATPVAPAAMPAWTPNWNLTESRFNYIANYKPTINMSQSYITLNSPMGMVGLDWTVSVKAWFNQTGGGGKSMCEAVSRENCRRNKASGMVQRCCIYHNTALALGWLESQRAAMDDPSKRDYFLQYPNGSIYSEDINLGRQWFWNHSNPAAAAYFVSSVVGSLMVDGSADCTFTDDTCGVPEEHPQVMTRIGMTPAELSALQKATARSLTTLGAELAKVGKWLGSAGSSITGGMRGATFSKSACTKFMDTYCEVGRQKEMMTLGADWRNHSVNQSIAAFLITRPPIAYVSHSCPMAVLLLQPGEPMVGVAGLCIKEGGGVYSRAWTAGVARLDCAAWTSELPFPAITL